MTVGEIRTVKKKKEDVKRQPHSQSINQRLYRGGGGVTQCRGGWGTDTV